MVALDFVKVVLQNIITKNECVIVFMLLYYDAQLLIKLSIFVRFLYISIIVLFEHNRYFTNFHKIICSLYKIKKLASSKKETAVSYRYINPVEKQLVSIWVYVVAL